MRKIALIVAAILIPVAVMAGPASAASSGAATSLPQAKFTLYEHLSHINCVDPAFGECTARGTLHVGGRRGPIVGTEYRICSDAFCEAEVTMFSPEFGEGTFVTLGYFPGFRFTRLRVVAGTGDFAGVRGHVGDTMLSPRLNRLDFDLLVRIT
jgi:hypothetical protein